MGFIDFIQSNFYDFITYTGFANAEVGNIIMIAAGIFFIVSSPFFACPIIIAYSQQQNSRKLLLYYEFFVKFYEYGKKMAYKYLKSYRYISGRTCGEVYE